VRFVTSALSLGGMLLLVQSLPFAWRYRSVVGLSFLAFLFTQISFFDSFTLPGQRINAAILPVFFSAGVALFYFLFPSSWWYRLAILLFFAFSIYITFLSENIFLVAALRTIALLRAAQTAGFLLTLLAFFFLSNTVFSFRLFFWENMLLIMVISWPLFWHFLWMINADSETKKKRLFTSLVLTLILGELSLVVSFFPVNVLIVSLFLVCGAYVLMGLAAADLNGRLFAKTVREYLIVGVLMFLVLLLNISWR